MTTDSLHAAKLKARDAIDQLLDAIGDILLAHLENIPPPLPVVIHHTLDPSDTPSFDHPRPTPTRAPSRAPTWTQDEDELLRRHYPGGGIAAVIRAGVQRSAYGITSRANALGVRRERNPTPPTPPRTTTLPAYRATLRVTVLQLLLNHHETDTLLDAETLTRHQRATLHRLAGEHLATQEHAGLWRLTLAGLNAARAQKAAA